MARKKMVKKELIEEQDDILDNEDQDAADELDEVSPDAMHNKNVGDIAMKPSNTFQAMQMAVNLMGMMPQDLQINALDQMIQLIGQEARNIPDDAAAKNAATLQMKPSAAAGMKESIREAITEIFGDNKELSEEFREKAETLFEAALAARVALERERLRQEANDEADQRVDEAMTQLVEQLDQYLDYVTEAWITENQVAIESTLRNEINEELVSDLTQVLRNHNISIPEEKVDVVEALGEKVEALEAQLNDAINRNLDLEEQLELYTKDELVTRMSEGLVLSQKEKFKTLVEGLEFSDPESYEKKLQVVKDKYFPTKKDNKTGILQEDVTPLNEDKPVSGNARMNTYVEVMNHMMKK